MVLGFRSERARDEEARRQADARVADAVPPGMRIAAAWSWRLLVVAGVLAVFVFLIIQLRLIVVPLLVALLLAALLVPFSNWLQRHRWPKWLAVAVSEVGILAVLGGLIWLTVSTVVSGYPALVDQTLVRWEELKDWLLTSPLHLSEIDINAWAEGFLTSLREDTSSLWSGALSVGSSVGHFLAGFLLVLFATLFILIDGRGIWMWIVRLFPRRARSAIVGGGEAGWITLSNFVRVQVLVAFIDAVGIGLGAFILGLFYDGFPLVVPIAILVFLGSFIPVVGAVVSGALAVFIALVFMGPWQAFVMLLIVIGVQQLEGHVLQPFLVGNAVKVHPLAVVIVVGAGGFLAGIPGALFAVPLTATVNAIVVYIARGDWRTNPHPRAADVLPSRRGAAARDS
ncbi:AI-2E family transporter [Homoserinibacter sp. GY 40078]|uniref:AI-2E family transporter n=1 Tax=Homoserinibacter sp. GY 40078 TaxID=2603275 RepID=UPI0011C83ED3|nr:AI-2E family transporter [Homoserinibacter sp. GY 40078]TXK19553.1 AI-2E family transporter [Homoserinibacter sp. GY 40078]